ncbi:guanitoxin biosynthesis MATE family efflux transporter GntT [Leptolyngbya sp. O-77]|uniref:guanitoxin biosynthesis MATE family efflux transporter GntT n=1 Tax=Leptolyngbya sp. O-77 TaxID=1080068 RepID=UPI00074D4C4E|nr:guanitoxin biosynthesis MATE family efflux transporter GntT [Leptolyngbya sp. O-77]BAU42619.1 DNA-damage-inducible protein F [Leptolyngbya sp. O-77]
MRDSFWASFLRLASVNILSNLLVPLAGLLDVAFLGNLADIRHLAGVAIATVLFNYLYWTFGFLRMGTTGTTAQAVGRGDADEVLITGLRGGAIALVVGLGIVLLQLPLREIGFTLLSAAPEVKQAGRAYYNAMIWGAPATLLNLVWMGWFLGRGKGRAVLLLSAVSNGVNVVLNYWLIVRWGWASAGAGAATALSQYAMLGVALGLLSREVSGAQVRAVFPKIWNAAALKSLVLLNGNIVIRTFALITTFAVFTNLSAAMGTTVLAANTLLLQVVTLAAYFIDGLAFATETYAGQFHGGGQRDRLRALAELSGALSLGLGLAIALLFALRPQPLFRLLTHHADVLESVRQSVWWLLPLLGFGSIAYMLDGYFLGITAGNVLRNSSLLSSLLGFAPVAAIAWQTQSNPLLWLALTCFMAARMVTLGLALREADLERL